MTANLATPAYDVKVEPDVVYATAAGRWSEAPNVKGEALRQFFRFRRPRPLPLQMDIYLPDGDDASLRPLLLMMHGGSFYVGNKNEAAQTEWCRHFASLGYVAASINYRLGFSLTREDVRQAELRALDDADAALDYLLNARPDLRIDPGKVFAAGTSAGATTAMNLAFRLYGDVPPMAERRPVEGGGKLKEGGAKGVCRRDAGARGRLGDGFRIRAVANLWGYVHDLSVLERADVPILSFQSVIDPVVPYDDGYPFARLHSLSRLFSDRLYGTHAVHRKAISVGLMSEHHPCPERRHRLHADDADLFTPRFYEVRDAMVRFFGEVMSSRSVG